MTIIIALRVICRGTPYLIKNLLDSFSFFVAATYLPLEAGGLLERLEIEYATLTNHIQKSLEVHSS